MLEHAPGVRLKSLAAACLSLVSAAVLAPPALAVGPEAPVDFVTDAFAQGFMVMVIEPAQIADLNVTRIIYRDGEPIAKERIAWNEMRAQDYRSPFTRPEDFKYQSPEERAQPPQRDGRLEPFRPLQEGQVDAAMRQAMQRIGRPGAAQQRPQAPAEGPPKRVGVLLPLAADSMRELPNGPYAEKFVAEARLVGQDPAGKPLTMIRWAHFVIADRRPKFITPAEYNRLVDPPVGGVDPLGQKIQLNLGRGAVANIRLEQTKLNAAIPVGRFGGAASEQPDAADQADAVSIRETDER